MTVRRTMMTRWFVFLLTLVVAMATPVASETAVAAPVAAAADEREWYEGDWAIAYDDAALERVAGFVEIGGVGAHLDLVHPQTGAIHRIEGKARLEDGRLVAEFPIEGHPLPGDRNGDTSAATLPPPVAGATPIAVPVGSELVASLEGGEASIRVAAGQGPRGPLRVILADPGTDPVESLEGHWEYEVANPGQMRFSRHGDYDAAELKVSAPERWVRMPPHIEAVVALERPDAARTTWLTLAGRHLPLTPRSRLEFASLSEQVVATGRTRPGPRERRTLDVEVVLAPQLDADPKGLTLNAQPGVWLPDLPDVEPVDIRYVRAIAGFEPAELLYTGEQFHLQARYVAPPYAERHRYVIRRPDGEPVEVALDRSDDDPSLYRSAALQLIGADERAPALGLGIVQAGDGDALQAAQVDVIPPSGGKSVGIVSVVEQPPTRWEEALERARRCRESGQSVTEFDNVILTESFMNLAPKIVFPPLLFFDDPEDDIRVLRTEIELEDHAAALLLRDELVAALTGYVADANDANPVDFDAPAPIIEVQHDAWTAVRRAETIDLIQRAWARERHGLFAFDVQDVHNPIDGQNLTYSLFAVLSHNQLRWQNADVADWTGDPEWEEFLEDCAVVIAQAKGKSLSRAVAALARAQAVDDCDIGELLKVVGPGLDQIVMRIIPQMVRRPHVGEPAWPRLVPDTVARSRLRTLYVVAACVAAQEEYSSIDSDVAILAVTAPFAVGGVVLPTFARTSLVAARALRASEYAMGSLDLFDLYITAIETNQWVESWEEERFALGVAGVAGASRADSAKVSSVSLAQALFTVAVSHSLNVGPKALELIRTRRIDVSEGTRALVWHHAARDGVGSLNSRDRAIFDRMVGEARGSGGTGDIGPSSGGAPDAASAAADGGTGTRNLPAHPEAIVRVAEAQGASRPADAADGVVAAADGADANVIVSRPGGDGVHARSDEGAFDGLDGDTDPGSLRQPRAGGGEEVADATPAGHNDGVTQHGDLRNPTPGVDADPVRIDEVGPGGHGYDGGDRQQLADYLRDHDGVRDENLADVVSFWEGKGQPPDVVMAGRAFTRGHDPAVTGQSLDDFRRNLDRYLEQVEGISDPGRRRQAIDDHIDRVDRSFDDTRPGGAGRPGDPDWAAPDAPTEVLPDVRGPRGGSGGGDGPRDPGGSGDGGGGDGRGGGSGGGGGDGGRGDGGDGGGSSGAGGEPPRPPPLPGEDKYFRPASGDAGRVTGHRVHELLDGLRRLDPEIDATLAGQIDDVNRRILIKTRPGGEVEAAEVAADVAITSGVRFNGSELADAGGGRLTAAQGDAIMERALWRNQIPAEHWSQYGLLPPPNVPESWSLGARGPPGGVDPPAGGAGGAGGGDKTRTDPLAPRPRAPETVTRPMGAAAPPAPPAPAASSAPPRLEGPEDLPFAIGPTGHEPPGNWHRGSRVPEDAGTSSVDLWHGSRADGTDIASRGFEFRGFDDASNFGNTRESAQNALHQAYMERTDPALFRARIPRRIWDELVENGHIFQRPYAGYSNPELPDNGRLPDGTLEYRINTVEATRVINRYLERVSEWDLGLDGLDGGG